MAHSEGWRLNTASLTGMQRVAVALALFTGLIHLLVGVKRGQLSLVLAGVGFGAGIALFLANYRRYTLYLLGSGYVALQVILWAVFQQGEYTLIGFVDKTIQVLLLVILVYLARSRH